MLTRLLLVAAGSLITLAGVVFTLQGVGVIGGSFMSGTTTWAVAGPVIALAVKSGSIEDTPVEPLTRMLLASVMAAAQYVATSAEPEQARVEAGRTVDMLLDRLRRDLKVIPRR